MSAFGSFRFLLISIEVAYHDFMSGLANREEPSSEEYNPNYNEELKDDLPDATSHPSS
jgi:hypothetical protein